MIMLKPFRNPNTVMLKPNTNQMFPLLYKKMCVLACVSDCLTQSEKVKKKNIGHWAMLVKVPHKFPATNNVLDKLDKWHVLLLQHIFFWQIIRKNKNIVRFSHKWNLSTAIQDKWSVGKKTTTKIKKINLKLTHTHTHAQIWTMRGNRYMISLFYCALLTWNIT